VTAERKRDNHAGSFPCPLSDWLIWRSRKSANFRSSSLGPEPRTNALKGRQAGQFDRQRRIE
jgi:hypothetical protein